MRGHHAFILTEGVGGKALDLHNLIEKQGTGNNLQPTSLNRKCQQSLLFKGNGRARNYGKNPWIVLWFKNLDALWVEIKNICPYPD